MQTVMRLEASCHCGRARSRCDAQPPVPGLRCRCPIRRRTAGGGGDAIDLGADARTFEIEGESHLGTCPARIAGEDGGCRISGVERRVCRACGSALWRFDPQWPDLVHPHGSAIDTPVPLPQQHVRTMLGPRAVGRGAG